MKRKFNNLFILICQLLMISLFTSCPEPDIPEAPKCILNISFDTSKALRSAHPVVPEFKDVSFTVTATAVKDASTVSKSEPLEDSQIYQLEISAGTWNISVTGKNSAGEIILKNGNSDTVTVADNGQYSKTIQLYFQKDGKGSVNLTFNLGDTDIQKMKVKNASDLNGEYTKEENENVIRIDSTGISSGTYGPVFYFYDSTDENAVPFFALKETFEIRNNMITSKWVSNWISLDENDTTESYYIKDSQFTLSKEIIKNISGTIAYTAGKNATDITAAASDTDNPGTFSSPFATVGAAVSKFDSIEKNNNNVPYTIFADGTITESSEISGNYLSVGNSRNLYITSYNPETVQKPEINAPSAPSGFYFEIKESAKVKISDVDVKMPVKVQEKSYAELDNVVVSGEFEALNKNNGTENQTIQVKITDSTLNNGLTLTDSSAELSETQIEENDVKLNGNSSVKISNEKSDSFTIAKNIEVNGNSFCSIKGYNISGNVVLNENVSCELENCAIAGDVILNGNASCKLKGCSFEGNIILNETSSCMLDGCTNQSGSSIKQYAGTEIELKSCSLNGNYESFAAESAVKAETAKTSKFSCDSSTFMGADFIFNGKITVCIKDSGFSASDITVGIDSDVTFEGGTYLQGGIVNLEGKQSENTQKQALLKLKNVKYSQGTKSIAVLKSTLAKPSENLVLLKNCSDEEGNTKPLTPELISKFIMKQPGFFLALDEDENSSTYGCGIIKVCGVLVKLPVQNFGKYEFEIGIIRKGETDTEEISVDNLEETVFHGGDKFILVNITDKDGKKVIFSEKEVNLSLYIKGDENIVIAETKNSANQRELVLPEDIDKFADDYTIIVEFTDSNSGLALDAKFNIMGPRL